MRIAVLGLGSVGYGLLSSIVDKHPNLTITGVADSKSAGINPDGIDITSLLAQKKETGICGDPSLTARDVVTHAPYDLLVEVTPTDAGTGEPAYGYIKEALSRGAHVVTSNKGPVALYYNELHELAQKNNVSFRYEATVAGAIPILHVMQHDLLGNTITALYGVLNGTCNYILTRMAEEGLTYTQALAEARELGYAEADPTYDVKGIDAGIKLVILANTIFQKNITLNDVSITGIDLLTDDALRLAEHQDCTIRLIGEIVPGTDLFRISPRIIPKNHPLVVKGTLNAITISTDMAGDLTFIGKGAGSIETASAILGDILYISQGKCMD
ncbi:MAG: homoserine dehydrogenase [Methanospirillaceae archaeon]|nr:homoserine dehydrogenase [Methanospirillaceae archaeon]